MENSFNKIQAEAFSKLGRELEDQELQSFLEMKVMEVAFEGIESDHPEQDSSNMPFVKEK